MNGDDYYSDKVPQEHIVGRDQPMPIDFAQISST